MKERVVYEVDGAIDVFLYTEKELEWPAGLVAGWEGYVGQLALGIGDVLASISINQISDYNQNTTNICNYLHRPVQAANGHGLPDFVPRLNRRSDHDIDLSAAHSTTIFSIFCT